MFNKIKPIKTIFTLIMLTSLISSCAFQVVESVDVIAEAEETPFQPVQTMDNAAEKTTPSTEEENISHETTYLVVDTNQETCFDNSSAISCPYEGDAFYGQDAQYEGHQPSYSDNGDGTITDLNTSLMWIKDAGEKVTYSEALSAAESFEYAGYDDWRIPTIKELYSLMDFSGMDLMSDNDAGNPFIDDDIFVFEYGDTSVERIIDSQWITTSIYTSDVMNGQECFFGVNFADGRIKCYPTSGRMEKTYFLRYVRGNESYGENNFTDSGDGTISDLATGLMWQQSDSSEGMDWEVALNYCEDLTLAGYDDWHLPNAKELQSIVDYSRSPDATGSAAIDPIFNISQITNETGAKDYPFFWTSTTHISTRGGNSGVYISFGESLGYFNNQWQDVHGAGAQRSDPKSGSSSDYPSSHGPQGDVMRVFNYARCVRDNSSNLLSSNASTSTTVSQQENVNTNSIFEEVTLFAPISGSSAYLIDSQGNTIHEWQLSSSPGFSVYLLDNNDLLATYSVASETFDAEGISGGGIEILDWEGNQVWSFELSNETYRLHHDIEYMENGNILAIALEKITEEDALAAGVDSSIADSLGEIWSEAVLEIDPDTNDIVWEWHAWDHLLPEDTNPQDYQELINPNYPATRRSADWLHINAIDYNESLDQILLSSRTLSEIWIIDHNTTTKEAAGENGNLLYRWGNPETYGSSETKQLYGQHDAEWIDPDSPSSNILIFNNGDQRLQPYSTVIEIDLEDSYQIGQAEIIWEYGNSGGEESFFAERISGAQRLANGNTLICVGTDSWLFEVNENGEKVWEFVYENDKTTSKRAPNNNIFRADRYYLDISSVNSEVETTDKDSEAAINPQREKQPTHVQHTPANDGNQQHPDLAAAAAQLGVSESLLREAMGEPGNPPDLAEVAQILGVTVEELQSALVLPMSSPPGGDGSHRQ